MARPHIQTEVIYHVYNRGVEKRDVFCDDGDRLRFIHYLFHFNDIRTEESLRYHLATSPNIYEVGPRKSKAREPVVDILAFALMPNHYHLMIQQRQEGGLSLFMQRLGTGYTMFFNEKYDHSGVLFQGKYKYKPVENDLQLHHLPHYIHLNPVALLDARDPLGTPSFEQLAEYRWSSLRDYLGIRNFPSVLCPQSVLDIYHESGGYRKSIEAFFGNVEEVGNTLGPLAL